MSEDDGGIPLDEVDRGILYALQRNAREATNAQIAEEVGVSASTVRNRIDRLEESGIVEGYEPKLDYEQAGFPLRIQFDCSAPVGERSEIAETILSVGGVVNVREMLTSEHNVFVEVVATNTRDLAAITERLNDHDLVVHSSEIVTRSYSQPFNYFEFDE